MTRGFTIAVRRLVPVVALLAWGAPAAALPPTSGDPPAEPPESEPEPPPDLGDCTPSEHIECPERCPSFGTCFATDQGEDGQIAYAVDDQIFACDGIDCNEASKRLDDYCCERGEFEPGGGGGCSVVAARPTPAPGLAALAALWLLGAAGAGFERRRTRSRRL